MMKIYLVLSFFICCTFTIHAQQNFEGEITYRTHIENEKDEELKIFFGVNKIKIIFYQDSNQFNKMTLVLIDSSAIYDINKQTERYSKKLLKVSKPNNFAETKLICAFETKAVQAEPNLIAAVLGNFLKAENTTYYLSDKLVYNVPIKYTNNPELAMLQGNKIILGLYIDVLDPYKKADSTKNVISIEAVSIKPMHIEDSEFAIPSNYEKEFEIQKAEEIKEDKVAEVKKIPKKRTTKQTKSKPTVNKRKQ
jgi:hypothetical protein